MKKILIVDDDIRYDKMMSFLLLSKGFESVYALSGIEALEILRTRERPDLILMDVMMPKMDGFDTIREVRKIKGLSDVPIIMLSAVSDPEKIEKASDLGAVDYVEKPFSPSDVIARISKVIGESEDG